MCRKLICSIFFTVVLGLAGHVAAALPAGWLNRDIGTAGGSASEVGGTWTVSGDGADVWGGSDAFHFVYLPLSCNGQITARVTSYGTGSNRWSKGGVMIRETLTPGSRNAVMAITGGEGGGLTFQNRPATGAASYSAHDYPTATPPYWVRLKREGDSITGYSSPNGVDWVQQPDGTGASATSNPVHIPMANDVFVGLFVTSHAAGEVRTYTFDNVTVGGLVSALEPEPEDGAIHPNTWAELTWVPGSTADSHNVYFGESFTDVSNGTGGTFQGNQRSTSFAVGLPGSPYPDGLVPDTTYYWRVDEVEADGVTTHKGNVWCFFVPSGKAHHPVPPDGAKLVAADVTLTWAVSPTARSHTVYFGDDFNDVNNATGGSGQIEAIYTPGPLEFDKTYYWRVDEFEGGRSSETHRGDVWSFSTTPEFLVSSPALWLDASDIDGDGDTNDNPAGGIDITIWADKSGNGNDAAGSTAPSYSTSAINGKAAVHFQPNEYLVGQKGFGSNITTTMFIVGVLYSEAKDSSIVIFSTQPSGGTDSARRGLCVSAIKESTVIKTDRGMTFPDNPVGLANPYLVVDVDTGNVDSNAFNVARFIDGGSNDLDGDIAEIIVYDRELTTAEKNQVASYLAQKYSLGSVNIPDRPTMTLRGLSGLAEQWLANGCSAENCWCDGADLDYSGKVDSADQSIFEQSSSRPRNAYYVATDGRDSNPGTEQLPWRTIQKAADTLAEGETVYIKEGTYNERVWVQNSGTPGNFITLTAYPGHTVTIDGTGIQFDWFGLFNVVDKSYIKVSGLRVINTSFFGIYVGGNSNNIIIEKNYTYNTGSSGITAWRGSEPGGCSDIIISGNEIELAVNGESQECISISGIDRFEVRYNYIHHGSLTQTLEHSTGGEGIDTKDGCSNGKVYGNCVYRTYNKVGIYVDAWDEDSSNIEVFGNIVHDCQTGFAVASEAGGVLENIRFYNNLAYNNDTWGIFVNAWHDDSVLKHGRVINNTFYNNLGGIFIGDEIFEDLVIRNNISSRNEQAQIVNTSENKHRNQQHQVDVGYNLIDGFKSWWCEIYGLRPVVGDPCFVNPSLGDFHLKPNSPAIDKGSSINAPSYDFEGDPRPVGSAYDIGIDEYCK